MRLRLLTLLLVTGLTARAELRPEDRRSDTVALSPATRAMQEDDAANPGMLAVLDGEVLWNAPANPTGRSCASCHGAAPESMRGVAARYPAWDEASERAVNLAGRIDLCRTRHQDVGPLPAEGHDRLALTAYVAHQSRGLPIAPASGAGLDAARSAGRTLFTRRMGQLNLSCAICHDDHWGRQLAGAPIPQGHPVGYPVYRLEWQAIGSLERRLRNCLTGMRAEPFSPSAPELVALEAYLVERASGLLSETPAVRP